MQGLRLNTRLGGRGGAKSPISILLNGLSFDSLGFYAAIDTHSQISATVRLSGLIVTPEARIWSSENPAGPDKSGAAATFGTGASPTDLAAADDQTVWLHVRVGDVWVSRSFAVRYSAPEPLALTTTTGTPQVGQTLSGVVGDYSPADVTREWRWTREGAVIPGATGQTYVVQPGDIGAVIQRQERARRTADSDPFSWSPWLGGQGVTITDVATIIEQIDRRISVTSIAPLPELAVTASAAGINIEEAA